VHLRLGVDIACRAAHQASLADERGEFLWSGRSFRTSPQDLERLWSMLPAAATSADVTVVMEPTRNAWVALAAWFRRRGATVVLVPPERAADLRAYYAKHTKSDRLDSRLLARLPLLHPEGLHAERGLGPGDALRRATKLRSTLVTRRSKGLARLDALLEILGPGWRAAPGGDLETKTALRFLAAEYADPDTVRRLGRARLARFFARHSRGAWGEAEADALLRAAADTFGLWEGELEYPDLAEDIALEARLAVALTAEIRELDERIGVLLARIDPAGITVSAPGVGAITGAAILGRLGDPSRFASLAAARSFTGLVPALDASGQSGRHGGPTKRGDATLREALFMAADHARRLDPTLAARYPRLMTEAGKHHTSAICHIAPALLTRLIACWKRGEPYVLRDVDGRPVTLTEARAIIAARYTVPAAVRLRQTTLVRPGRTATETRGRQAPHRPARSPVTLFLATDRQLIRFSEGI
jgi:transposase